MGLLHLIEVLEEDSNVAFPLRAAGDTHHVEEGAWWGRGGLDRVPPGLKSVLGRLSLVAGALRHVRPFLAPLFAWSSSLAGGTFARFPDAVIILLEFVREEVARKPVRSLEPLLPSPTDIFRVDAKAAGEEIVIGGWESWRGAPQSSTVEMRRGPT